MRSRCSILGFVFTAGLLFDCQPAHAAAIALSEITARHLQITPEAGFSIVFGDPFTTFAFAQAQNSLGEEKKADPSHENLPSLADAAVTWANGHALSESDEWTASSSVNLPGDDPKAANSVGQASWFNTFTIIGGIGPVLATFSVEVSGALTVRTDSAGKLAETETFFNLFLDGDPLFMGLPKPPCESDSVVQDSASLVQRKCSIGPNAARVPPRTAFAGTLTTTVALAVGTPYALFLGVDSESRAINEMPVPEPSTLTLIGLAVTTALGRRWRLRGRP